MQNKYELVFQPIKEVIFSSIKQDTRGRNRGARCKTAMIEGYKTPKAVQINSERAHEILNEGELQLLPVYVAGLQIKEIAHQQGLLM